MNIAAKQEPFILIGRNGLLTSIALQTMATKGHLPLRVWIEATNSPLPALTERVCQAYSIPYTYSENLNQPNTVDMILKDQPAFGIVAGLGTILKETLLDGLPIVNLHIGVLPFFRGAHVNFWKMKADDSRYGASLHRMERTIDSGSIFDIAEIELQEVDGFELMRKNYQLAVNLLCNWLERKDKWAMVHSNSELEEKGAYYPIMKAADFALDVKQPVQTLYRQINRMRFYGPTRLQIEDRIYVTYRADLLSEVTQVTEPISISRVHADYLVLNHPTGLLGLHLYQSS